MGELTRGSEGESERLNHKCMDGTMNIWNGFELRNALPDGTFPSESKSPTIRDATCIPIAYRLLRKYRDGVLQQYLRMNEIQSEQALTQNTDYIIELEAVRTKLRHLDEELEYLMML